jgi:hypothetical protein
MRTTSSTFLVVLSLGAIVIGCSKSEPKPEPTAASAPAVVTAAPTANAVAKEGAAASKKKAVDAALFTTVAIALPGEEEKVSACNGDDVRIAVPERPGTDLKLVTYAPLGAPKREYAEGWLSPTVGAVKYTFSTKVVPAGTKEARIELQDGLNKGEKLVVKVDLACTGTPLKVPGACVDPKADATKRAKPFLAGTSATLDEMLGETTPMDLDGDGTKDRIFAVGLATTAAQFVYVMRGACGHYVGDLGGAAVKPLPTKHDGLPDLAAEDTSHCEGAQGPCKPKTSRLVFDGTEYKLAK